MTPRLGLVIVVPATTVDHGWRHHVAMTGPTGLDRPSWALTDQPHTVSIDRISDVAGRVDDVARQAIGQALRRFLELPYVCGPNCENGRIRQPLRPGHVRGGEPPERQ